MEAFGMDTLTCMYLLSGADPEPPLPGGGGGASEPAMKPKASLRREAPKGGGWGRGSPPPAGGVRGASPGNFLRNCIKIVHSECILR